MEIRPARKVGDYLVGWREGFRLDYHDMSESAFRIQRQEAQDTLGRSAKNTWASTKTAYFPLNTGCFIGILIMVYYNPHITR